MDIPLSQRGSLDSDIVARSLGCSTKPIAIYHSGLARTRYLAEELAEVWMGQVPILCDVRLRERNYGLWEGRPWDELFASDPEHFHDLINRPDEYRPPGGETTTEMQQRMREWYDRLLKIKANELVIAVSHSGPIASLCGSILNLPATEWSPWMLGYLESVQIKLPVVEPTVVPNFSLSKIRVFDGTVS
jgi:broad specificity phosphatase PhoE